MEGCHTAWDKVVRKGSFVSVVLVVGIVAVIVDMERARARRLLEPSGAAVG